MNIVEILFIFVTIIK